MQAKNRKIRRTIYKILPIVLIGMFFLLRPLFTAKEETIIRTALVERGTVTASVSANGVLRPLTTVEVKSNVGGQVVKLAVEEGDVVKPGQLIARIDPTDTLTAYEQSQADLASAQAKVSQAREQLAMQHTQNAAQIESAEQALAAARARLEQAEEQAGVQPKLTSASISQAKSSRAAAEASLNQLKSALIPQRVSSAQSAYDQARASRENARKERERQENLFSRGFVARSQVDAAEERYEVASAQFESAKRKLDTVKDETEQDLRAAEARLAQAQAELDNANANSVQVKIRQQELASARAAVKQAEAALQSAKASAREDRIRQGDIVQANSQVQRSQAALTNSRTQLGYTTVVAPRAGVVTKRYVEEGSIVTAGRSSFSGTGSGVSIVDIADVSRMFAEVSVDETDIAQIEVGQDVDVTIEAYPDELFTGKVTRIAPQSVTEQSVTTIPVTVEIELPDQRLKPGMNVTCDFITGRAEDVLMVPSEAVTEEDNGNTVTLLVDGVRAKGETGSDTFADGEQVKRRVEIGIVGRDQTEITNGVKAGQRVVTAVIEPTDPSKMQTGGMGAPGAMGGPGGMGGRGMGRMR